jgi:DNA polymerase-3 subunit alpha
VNESECDFAVVGGAIRFGLNAVKNVGDSAARAIIAARAEGGPFVSLLDLTKRVDPQVINRRAVESLINAGALDSTGAPRQGMLEERVLEAALRLGGRLQDDRLRGQGSIFDLGDGPEQRVDDIHIPPGEFEKSELLRREKEALGLYVSEHPLQGIAEKLRRKIDCGLVEVERRRDGEIVSVGGIVGAIKQVTTKKGDPMVFVRLDDLTGSAEVVVFNSVYTTARDLVEMDRILVVKGRVDHKQEGETKLLAIEVAAFEETAERTEVRLRVDARRAPAGLVRELAELVKEFPGPIPVVVALETSEGEKTLTFGPQFRVDPAPDFFAEAKALLGEAAVV